MTRTHSARGSVSGFTLIELLVVTLILSILMAVAIPLYLSSVADARTRTCQANMQTIANAVQAAHIRANDVDYTTGNPAYMGEVNSTKCTAGGALADLQNVPICPNKGTYTVTADPTTGFIVSCSHTQDGTYSPGKLTPGTTP